MADLTRAGDELDNFLKQLNDLPDEELIVNPPGLMGCYTAKELREGLRMHALCVHSSGMGLASTYAAKNSTAFDAWMDRRMTANALGRQVDRKTLETYMARIKGLFSQQPASVASDPWRFD